MLLHFPLIILIFHLPESESCSSLIQICWLTTPVLGSLGGMILAMLCCMLVVLNIHSSLQLVSGSHALLSFADNTYPWLFRLSVVAIPHCVLSLLTTSSLLFSWLVVATISCWLAENSCFYLSRKYAVHCSVLCLLMCFSLMLQSVSCCHAVLNLKHLVNTYLWLFSWWVATFPFYISCLWMMLWLFSLWAVAMPC